MSRNKIKTVKEFIVEGLPQFDIIQRREEGKSVDISFIPTGEIFEHDDLNISSSKKTDGSGNTFLQPVFKTLFPPTNGEGIIQIVKRITDDQLFHQGDMVTTESGSGFIFEFKEDRIHCDIGLVFDQETTLVEINTLNIHETLADEELNDNMYEQ